MKPVLLFAVAAAALLPGANAELEACLEALGQLTTAPYSYALPFLNGGTGGYATHGTIQYSASIE